MWLEAQISADITRDMHETAIDNRTRSCSCCQAFHPRFATEVPQWPSRHSFLRILQSHMCERNFWLINRLLPFQTPTAATTSVMTSTTTNYCYSHDQPLLLVLIVTTCEHSADVVTTSAVVVSADTIALVLECYYTQNY